MDPGQRTPPGAPDIIASQEESRRLLRSQPRRLGFGRLHRARPRLSCANITTRVFQYPSNQELSTWLGQDNLIPVSRPGEKFLMSAPNENVLVVPSRNVLLTAAGLRGGFRNTSHDATRPRPSGRIEESQEGPDHATAGRRRDRPKRAPCSPAAEATQGQRRRGIDACVCGDGGPTANWTRRSSRRR